MIMLKSVRLPNAKGEVYLIDIPEKTKKFKLESSYGCSCLSCPGEGSVLLDIKPISDIENANDDFELLGRFSDLDDDTFKELVDSCEFKSDNQDTLYFNYVHKLPWHNNSKDSFKSLAQVQKIKLKRTHVLVLKNIA